MRLTHQMDRRQLQSSSATPIFRRQRGRRSRKAKQELANPAARCWQAFAQGISEGYRPPTLDGTARAAAAGMLIFWVLAIYAFAVWIFP
jgi:hypothetical protein